MKKFKLMVISLLLITIIVGCQAPKQAQYIPGLDSNPKPVTAPNTPNTIVDSNPTIITNTITDDNSPSTTYPTKPINLSGSDYPIRPIKQLTPGDLLSGDKNVVCVVGYTATVRNVTEKEKEKVFAEYGITNIQSGEYEIDHFVPLELGGSNSIKNLWPEPYNNVYGAREKDKVENYLHKLVCNNNLDLNVAQDEIVNDWTKIYDEIKTLS